MVHGGLLALAYLAWALSQLTQRRILTAEMTWLRRLLKVTRCDKKRNETVRGILHQELTLIDRIGETRDYFDGCKYRQSIIENDYCGGKLGLVVGQLGLVESVGLGLGFVRSLGLVLRVGVSVDISGSGDKPGLPPQ